MAFWDFTKKSDILYALRLASWEQWRETIWWLGFNVVGSFMPIWGSFFLLGLSNRPFIFRDFMKHGEFALYSAAFLAPALQVIAGNLRNKRYVLSMGSLLVAVIGLGISMIVYAGVVVIPLGALNLHEPFLFSVSRVLLPASLIFVFLVTLLQKQFENPNIPAIEETQVTDLQKKFEGKLGGGDAGR